MSGTGERIRLARLFGGAVMWLCMKKSINDTASSTGTEAFISAVFPFNRQRVIA